MEPAGTGPLESLNVSNITTSSGSAVPAEVWALLNETFGLEEQEYIFDRLYIRIIFIALYSLVFCFCFFGNLMVILVVTLHWRMRNITKFCLANLAFADLCVGVFCVYQNLSTYLINSWVLGEFLCKMYQFINGLSHTASILIMVVMCVERYLAILHPFRCKQLLTINRLRGLIIGVWLASAIYCSPKLYYIVTLRVFRMDGSTEIICAAKRTLYDSRTFDMIHFFLLFLLPLLAISILYTRVGITLWRSSKSQLPWTTGTKHYGGGARASSSVSRSSSSSSVTINNEESSGSGGGSRGTSERRKRLRQNSSRSPSSAAKNNRQRRHSRVQESSIDHRCELSAKFNSVFYKNCRNKMMNGMPDSSATPSMVVTIENKCHLVGPADIRTLAIDGLVENRSNGQCSGGSLRRPHHLHHHHRHHQHNYRTHNGHCAEGKVYFDAAAGDHDNENENVNARISNGHAPVHVPTSEPGYHFRGYNFKRKRVIKRLSRPKNLRGGREALKSRQTVVRMLIVIVVTFAVCNLPFHLRKMIQYWWPNYNYVSIYSTMATPLTHLIMYANCAINPIIYAFMSKTFWSSFKELVCCKWRRPHSRGYREPSTQIIPLTRSPRLHSRDDERDMVSMTED